MDFARPFPDRPDHQLGGVLGYHLACRLTNFGASEAFAPVNIAGPVRFLAEQSELGALGHRDISRAAGHVEHPQRVASGGGGRDVAEHRGDGTYVDFGVGQQVEEGDGIVDAGVAVDEQCLLGAGTHAATLEGRAASAGLFSLAGAGARSWLADVRDW